MAIDQRVLDTIALSRDEYDLIVSRLGREPTEVELGIFGALWSEHCGYKNSRPLLRMLPEEGPFVLTKRGEELGVPDLLDRIADESVGETPEQIMPFLMEKKHPALEMEPML